MTPKFPVCRATDLIRIISKLGFQFDRQKGSHAIYIRLADHARVVIPVHKGKDIKRKTLKGILLDLNITSEEFSELLKK